MKARKFVIGDIHSHFDEMMELFDVVDFDPDKDTLISLGDLVDRGPKPIEVIEKLSQIKNFIHILGNHDAWCHQYLTDNIAPAGWISQGGESTFRAYENNPGYKEKHSSFFEKAVLYLVDDDNRLFIHGGFDPNIPFHKQLNNKDLFIWDRSLVFAAMKYEQNQQLISEFNEIFVGHTPTQLIKENIPKNFSNLWMLDTGVHIDGRLTIMNIETKMFWQSTGRLDGYL